MELTQEDHLLIAQAVAIITEYKARTLKARAWHIYQQEWLPRALQQLEDNDFVVNHPKKNFFTWLLDQALWVKIPTPGMKLSDGKPLLMTEFGQELETICNQARLGQQYYDKSKTQI